MAEVQLSAMDGKPMLVMVGSFHAPYVKLVEDVLVLWSAQGHPAAVIDMTRTTHIGPALVEALVAAQRRGIQLTVRGASTSVQSILSFAVMTEYLAIEDAV